MYCKATATTVLIALSIAAAAASGPATQLGPAAADAAAAGNSPEEVANDYRAYRTHLASQSQDATTAQLADQAAYARAVLGITGAPTTRPYDGQRTPAAAPTEETR